MASAASRKSTTREEAQIMLLDRIRNFSPTGDLANALSQCGLELPNPGLRVLDELASRPFEAFLEVATRCKKEAAGNRLLLELFSLPVAGWDETHQMWRSIQAWQENFSLTAPWCSRAAYETFDRWERRPRALRDRRWQRLSKGYEVPVFTMEADGWLLLGGESVGDFRSRLREAFNECLDSHIEKVKAETNQTEALGSTTRHPRLAHEYLICTHILGASVSSVAWAYDVEEMSVSRSTRSLAAFLGLSPRTRPSR